MIVVSDHIVAAALVVTAMVFPWQPTKSALKPDANVIEVVDDDEDNTGTASDRHGRGERR